MPKLRNLHRRPPPVRHRGNQARHDAGLSNIPRMSTHNDDRHDTGS
jgi:hypothetical protein